LAISASNSLHAPTTPGIPEKVIPDDIFATEMSFTSLEKARLAEVWYPQEKEYES
jgi:hypothetical protein